MSPVAVICHKVETDLVKKAIKELREIALERHRRSYGYDKIWKTDIIS